jgi:hypothetical protein
MGPRMTEIDDVLRLDETADASSAARAAEEAMRTAVHATDASTGWPGLTGAADVYAVLGALGYTLELLPQLLDQLTGWLAAHAPNLLVDGNTGAPAELIETVRSDLDAALPSLAQGRERLAAAQVALAAVSGPVGR